MELCQDVIVGLSLLKDDSRVSKFQVSQLIEVVGDSLISQSDYGSVRDRVIDSAELKLLGLAIATIYLETAKNNKSLGEEVSLIELALGDASVDGGFIKMIVDRYKIIEKRLKNQLSLMTLITNDVTLNTINSIVDTRWRQDVIVRSKYRNQINEIKYLIDLSTDNGKQISFSSDLPGLQDFAHQLKDCCKVIENTFQNVI